MKIMQFRCLVAAATIAVAHGKTPKSATSSHVALAADAAHDANESLIQQKQAPPPPAPKAAPVAPKAPPKAVTVAPKAFPVAPKAPPKAAPWAPAKAAPAKLAKAKAAPVPMAPKAPPPANASASADEQGSGIGGITRFATQLIFGVAYYFFVVKNAEKLPPGVSPCKAAIEIQDMSALDATFKSRATNCLMAWCCSGPRAAHTFDSVGILNYWLGLVLMTCLPCCTLFWANHSTDLNVKLGGNKQGCIQALLCSMFCSCCLITQDAESLDLILADNKGLLGDSYGVRGGNRR